jgi:hypothetical protein
MNNSVSPIPRAKRRWSPKSTRYWRNRALYRTIRFRNRVRIIVWDSLARFHSQKPLEENFLLWNSDIRPDSRRASSPAYPRYLCDYPGSALIEPKYGYAIADNGVLIETSVSNSYFVRDSQTCHLFGLPSPARYFKQRYVSRDAVEIGPAISLATAWPENYFHFYNDFLPKMVLLEECEIDPAFPIVVPDKLFRQPFFHDAIRSERLSRWKYIAPEGRFLRCDRLVFCSDTYDISNARKYEEGLPLLGLDVEPPRGASTRRVFLTRSASRGRVLLNFDEIRPIIEEQQFELVDTEGMSLAAQAQLFQETRYLIGIHGAGLVNAAHAQQLDVLEIRPPGVASEITDYRGEYIPGAEFEIMCRSLGFGYHMIFGEPDEDRVHWRESFRLDPVRLSSALDNMLSSSCC